jgi:hypothetical protein
MKADLIKELNEFLLSSDVKNLLPIGIKSFKIEFNDNEGSANLYIGKDLKASYKGPDYKSFFIVLFNQALQDFAQMNKPITKDN